MNPEQNGAQKIGLAILGIALLAGAFYGGFRYGDAGEPSLRAQLTDINAPAYISAKSEALLDADFSLFWEAIELAKERYVRIDEIEDENILYGAIGGAIDALEDPYTVFLKPSDAKKFNEDIKGVFGGIVAEIGIREGQLLVISPLKGNPAERAGLLAGDSILQVNGTSTNNITIENAVKIIRGEPGTEVSFLIMRAGWDEAKEIIVERAIVNVPTFEWEMLAPTPGSEPSIAHFKLFSFNANASRELANAVIEALIKGTKGVILDMRNNSGGFLDVAVDVTGWFVNKGDVVVQQQHRDGSRTNLVARGSAALKNLPVVVLVNEGSASASEIVAGALRDHLGAKLIGKKTFGKGSVQELETLKNGSTLKVTIAEWLTPLGSSINKVGLEPDVEVEFGDDPETDLQFEKALEIISENLPAGRAIPTFLLGL